MTKYTHTPPTTIASHYECYDRPLLLKELLKTDEQQHSYWLIDD